MNVSAYTKYWIIAILTAVISALTYLESQPVITEATIISAVVLVIGLIVHDLENEPAQVTPPSG